MRNEDDLKSKLETQGRDVIIESMPHRIPNRSSKASRNALVAAAILAMQGGMAPAVAPANLPPKKRFSESDPKDMKELMRTRHKTLAKKRGKR